MRRNRQQQRMIERSQAAREARRTFPALSGGLAARRGIPRSRCPYPSGSEEAMQWKAGFDYVSKTI